MDLREAIRTTGSVREFRDEPVADALVASVLDDARFAPSGGNRQPWRVALVKDRAIRHQLAALMQPVWDEYVAASRTGTTPFNPVDYRPPVERMRAANALLDNIERVPVVLAIAVDLQRISAMDAALDRVAVVPGASIYPFCWNVLLAARERGLGGVLTTFLSRVEVEATPLLKLPAHHALAATICLGYPVHQPTRLRRKRVEEFASIDSFEGVPLA
jgi:nitroreductase